MVVPTPIETILVGAAGFEPAASWSRTKRDTKLRHAPIWTFVVISMVCSVYAHYGVYVLPLL